MSRFKFGVCEWAFPCWGDLSIKMAAEAGFDGVQLADVGGWMNGYPLLDKRVQDHYLNAAAKYGIEFPQLHLYSQGHLGYFRSRVDSEEGKICFDTVKNAVIAASEMGIGSVAIDGMKMLNPAKKAHVFQVAEYSVKLGEEYGVKICMETDMTVEDTIAFLDALDGKLTLCFDTHNPCMYGTGLPQDMIRAFGKERIDHFHMKDNAGDSDGFVTYESPLVKFGSGIACFRESAEAVRDIGFEGWIVSENMYYKPSVKEDAPDYITAAALDLKAMKEAYGDE